MRDRFEGFYFKQQKDGQTFAFIPGRSQSEAFIQVVTNDSSYNVPYKLGNYSFDGDMRVGDSVFSTKGMSLHIDHGGLQVNGEMEFSGLTPIDGDIMGPFRHFPMECRHIVVSMNHDLHGSLSINGECLEMTGGKGYIEGDSGTSFPSRYSWVHCNSWDKQDDDCSVMVSVARIPFAGLKFWGGIAVVWFLGKEHRLATYRGMRILKRTANEIILSQRGMRLSVTVPQHSGHELAAPHKGDMKRVIRECAAVRAKFVFEEHGKTVFSGWSNAASYEYVE